jgi:hypothetical protein
VVGNSNQGLLSPNEVLGTDANGDISVLGLGSNLQLVASVLSVKNGIFEPVFAKKEGFNNDYGTTAGTVAQGNDSRIVNGQTAYDFTSNFSIADYHAALDGRYLQSHPDTSEQETVQLNGAAVVSQLVLDQYGHITSITTRNLLPPNIGAEPAIGAKGTAFNKNFGTTADTVSQGNDSRIVNGQTAYNWGNHAEAGYALASAIPTDFVSKSGGGTFNGTIKIAGNGNVENTGQYYGDQDGAQNVHSTGGALDINFNDGNNQSFKLTSNVTSIAISGVKKFTTYNIEFEQDDTGGRTVSLPASWCWRGGSVDSITSGANKKTILTLVLFHNTSIINASLAKDYYTP